MLLISVWNWPLGAPSIACLNMRPLHGLNRPKPASASQFFVVQSALSYSPGQTIDVEIMTHSNERYFRGFLIQAYDPSTGAHIGQFASSNDSRPLASCSGATHKNNLNKQRVKLLWVPPGMNARNLAATNNDPADTTHEVSSSSGWHLHSPVQPTLSMSLMSKRQLDGRASSSTTNSTEQPPTKPLPAEPMRQVRFRATIVVTYDEFYTGFESSDQYFDKFDFATTNAPTS